MTRVQSSARFFVCDICMVSKWIVSIIKTIVYPSTLDVLEMLFC